MVDIFQRNKSFKTKLQIRFIVKSIMCFVQNQFYLHFPIRNRYQNRNHVGCPPNTSTLIVLFSSPSHLINGSISWNGSSDPNRMFPTWTVSVIPVAFHPLWMTFCSCSCHVVVTFYQPFWMVRLQAIKEEEHRYLFTTFPHPIDFQSVNTTY